MINKETLEKYGAVQEEVSIKTICSFHIGGLADYIIYPKNEIALMQLIKLLTEQRVLYKIWGKGSNILPSDENYHGVIIKLDRTFIDVFIQSNSVIAQAGVSLIALAYQCAKDGLSGLEFASGIPGTLGGAVYMNAGAYHACIFDLIKRVYVLKATELIWMNKSEIEYRYRYSSFQDHIDWTILAIEFDLSIKDPLLIQELMSKRQSKRLLTQPLQLASAGSVFRNPKNRFAWELIDICGLRNYRIGDAMISQMHTNFIVNMNEAKAMDVYNLIQLIKQVVFEKQGIMLCEEIEYFNWSVHE